MRRRPYIPRGPEQPRQGIKADLRAIAALLPYVWPADAPAMRLRVLIAVACLVVSKVANVSVPVFYKDAVDALTPGTDALIVVPIAVILGYGLARVMAQAFGELRDAVFARVAQRAIRRAGLRTFRHLHALALRFHLDRRTGAVSRAVERGSRGIEFLLNFMIFNILPTLLEILMVCGVLWNLVGGLYA
ncbi:MAG: ABC transporter transmembrane domain-containing protein, partial [Rhodospirillales bacterium]